jgi:hypothetical protein
MAGRFDRKIAFDRCSGSDHLALYCSYHLQRRTPLSTGMAVLYSGFPIEIRDLDVDLEEVGNREQG